MLTPLAWLLGLFLPACGTVGAAGVPTDPPAFSQLVRPPHANAALAAPAGYTPRPDIETPAYDLPPDRLLAAVRRVAASRPSTFPLAENRAALQEGWVSRSLVFNFPDIIWAEVRSADTAKSQLVLYSRSVYGYGDLGVNRRRVAAWLAELAKDLNDPEKK